jgi:hypothetical protein
LPSTQCVEFTRELDHAEAGVRQLHDLQRLAIASAS